MDYSKDWTTLSQEIEGLPPEFAAAVSTGRPELAQLINRPLTMDETEATAHALAVLLETNQQLQAHSRELAKRLEQVRDNANGLAGSLLGLCQLANFQEPDPCLTP